MNDNSALLPGLLVLGGAGTGIWILRQSWAQRSRKPRWPVFAGWLLILFSLVWPAWILGAARGPFIALALVSTVALVIVSSGYTLRQARRSTGRASLAPEPSTRTTTRWRETLRWLLAGPIGMIAAMAVGIAYAALVPGEPQTRLVMGGLLVPVAWGGAMAWTLSDDRILRATAVLVGVAVVGFAAAMLKGF
jgi:hypothetical protein